MPYKVVRELGLNHRLKKNPRMFRGAYINTFYPVGRWVKAPKSCLEEGYGLTYFEGIIDAVVFLAGHVRDYVFECEVRGVMEMPVYRLAPNGGAEIRDVMDGLVTGQPNKGVCPTHLEDFPPGTQMAKYLKLVRGVKITQEMANLAADHICGQSWFREHEYATPPFLDGVRP